VKTIAKYVACLGLAVAGQLAVAQTPPTPQQTQDANLEAYIGMLRQDLKAGKVVILTVMMDLDLPEAARFWPVYNEYDQELTKLADERIAFIRMYADNYEALTDAMATKIANGMMDVEAKRVELRKQYFARISKALTPKDAARWLQVEAQIEKVVDLQILASLPIV
jgi:hypothetical protein